VYKNQVQLIFTTCTHIIAGAGGGIGRAICRVMAREGATVVATDLNIKNVQTTVEELTGKVQNLNAIKFSKLNFRRRSQKLSTGCVRC